MGKTGSGGGESGGGGWVGGEWGDGTVLGGNTEAGREGLFWVRLRPGSYT